jgi:hypothetical protein
MSQQTSHHDAEPESDNILTDTTAGKYFFAFSNIPLA